MIGFYDYTVIATYVSLISAVVGVAFAFVGCPREAVCCLMLSGFLDMFDGMIARTKKNRTENEKNFGIQIDSLSDLIAFGILPAAICLSLHFYSGAFSKGISIALVFVCAVYVLAALIRLAYFNVTEEDRQKQEEGKRKFYDGMPVTTVALILPVAYVCGTYMNKVDSIIFASVLFICAMLFVSRIKIAKPGIGGAICASLLGAAEALFMFGGGIFG